MDMETVTISLSKYNELREFKEKVLEGGYIVFHDPFNGNEAKLFTKDEVITELNSHYKHKLLSSSDLIHEKNRMIANLREQLENLKISAVKKEPKPWWRILINSNL